MFDSVLLCTCNTLCFLGRVCVKYRSTNTKEELCEDRMWPEAELWELPCTVLILITCVSHIHTQQQQRAYCQPGTLKTLSKSTVRMSFFSQRGWTVKNRVREEQRMKEGSQNHVRPLRLDCAGIVKYNLVHPTQLDPFWNTLTRFLSKPAEQLHNWHLISLEGCIKQIHFSFFKVISVKSNAFLKSFHYNKYIWHTYFNVIGCKNRGLNKSMFNLSNKVQKRLWWYYRTVFLVSLWLVGPYNQYIFLNNTFVKI